MKYKLSKYTHVLDNGKDFLLYNFLHKNIVKVPNNDVINDILIRQDIDLKNDVEAKNVSLVEKLIHAGYLVDINADEDYIGKLAYYDTLYDSGLLLTILASEACNFRCKYCYENFGRGNILDDVADSIILFAEKNIRNYKRLGVDWFGGEPLLAIDKIEHISKGLISICRKYGKPYTASMTTNGYLVNLKTRW